MWDKDDHTARWVQGICGIVLLGWAVVVLYLIADGWGGPTLMPSHYSSSGYLFFPVEVSGCIAAFFAVRCLWYALTGRGNVNRDNYD